MSEKLTDNNKEMHIHLINLLEAGVNKLLLNSFFYLSLLLSTVLSLGSSSVANNQCGGVSCATAVPPVCCPGQGLQTVTDESGCCSRFVCKPIPQICNQACPKTYCLPGQRPSCTPAQNGPGKPYQCCPNCKCVPMCNEPCPKIQCLPEQRPCCWWPQPKPGEAQPCCPTCQCVSNPNCDSFPH